MKRYFHSVVLDKSKCKGCTTCVKGCPTQAIRVRKGKAGIIQEKCIDCGKCIRICPHYAKNAITGSLENMKKYKYNVALVPPSLIAQFKSNISTNKILTAIKGLGFDQVKEVAYGAEILSKAIKLELKDSAYSKPAIPITCPAVVELMQVRFPELLPHLIHLELPMEVIARLTLESLIKEKGLQQEEIGLFYFTPCASKSAKINDNASCITDSISIKDIFPEILLSLKNVKVEEPLQKTSKTGQFYGNHRLESSMINARNSINVDGIENVIQVLEKIERGYLEDIDYFVGFACTGGCAGGCLTLENSFIANKRISDRSLENNVISEVDEAFVEKKYNKGILDIKEEILPRIIPPLDSDLGKAIEKMTKMDEIEKSLPGLDCGSCGAPNCKSLAEDIVRGYARTEACIFLLKEVMNEHSRLKRDFSIKVVPITNKSDGEYKNEDQRANRDTSLYIAK